MFPNSFLVIGVNPAHNEQGVPVNVSLSIEFSTDMDTDSISTSNIILKVVNGAEVNGYAIDYINVHRRAIITLAEDLEPGVSYELRVEGGEDGVSSITGDYLPETKSFRFTTSYLTSITAPQNLSVSISNGYPTVTWDVPAEYDPTKEPTYEVRISTSSDPLSVDIWPASGDINTLMGTTLNVPKKLPEGPYYAHVKAANEDGVSDWATAAFAVEAEVIEPTPSEPSDGGGVTADSFYVSDVYPKHGSVDITPENIIIAFVGSLDESTITSDSVYVVPKWTDGIDLTPMHLMTEYAPSKGVLSTYDTSMDGYVKVIAELQPDTEYTLVIDGSKIKDTNGTPLGGIEYRSFVSEYTKLYGDPELVREDITTFIRSVSDRILYKYLHDNSVHAYEIVSQTDGFNAEDYESGKAPYYLHQYVRFQTAYDLLLNGYIRQSSGSGSSISLGDLSVDKSSEQADITSMLQNFKDRIKPWLDAIHGHNNRGYAKPIVAVKGENGAPYPEPMTRAEFAEFGG